MAPSTTSPTLEHALDLARRGLRIFPLIPNGKTPVFSGWKEAASSDPAIIRQWFETDYPAAGVAVATGRGVLAIDADVKGGKRGVESLNLLERIGADLDFLVATPSGGRHAYFRVPDGDVVPNSVDRMSEYPGIDVRGDGGYVAAPGTPGYEIIRGGEIPVAPPWLIERVRSTRALRRVVDDRTPLVELDDPSAISRAIEYLKSEAPEAVEGAGGQEATFITAAHLKDFGISEATALELMLDERWNHTKASPPWSPDELEVVVGNAYRYGQNPPGIRSAAAEFDVVEVLDRRVQPAVAQRPRGLYRLSFDEMADRATKAGNPYLVKDVLDQGTFNVMYGPSNSGKTFVALDLSYHVATGADWGGHKVAAGAVVYIATEGGLGIGKRIAALRRHHSPSVLPPLDIVPCPVNLHKDLADVKRIAALAEDAAREHGQPLRLIVIDTLSRALAGGDENSSVDMGAFIQNVDRLREAVNCAVLVVHHTGKVVANGARGWSGLRAAIDTEIEITDARKIEFEKQRDMAKGPPRPFALTPIMIGIDDEGDEVTSCVCVVPTLAELDFGDKPTARRPVGRDGEMLEVIETLMGKRDSVTWPEWQEAYCRERDGKWHPGLPLPLGCSEQNLRKIRNRLLGDFFVRQDGEHFTVGAHFSIERAASAPLMHESERSTRSIDRSTAK